MVKRVYRIILGALFFSLAALAFSTNGDVSAAKVGLRVSPVDFHIELNPGEVYKGSFKLSNEGDIKTGYKAEITPYSVDEIEKDEQTHISYSEKTEYSEITEWIKYDKDEGEIEPNQTITVDFSIHVPKDAPGMGQYAALLVSTVDLDKGTGGTSIGQTASVGPVLYAKVNGSTKEQASIIKNNIDGFLFNPPIAVSSAVKNEGNVHTESVHIMRVYPLFSGESIYNTEESPKKYTVLPGATHYQTVSWDDAPGIGIFRVESEVRIFDKVDKQSKIIIICPFWVLILIVGFVIALIYWLVSRSRERKKETTDEQ